MTTGKPGKHGPLCTRFLTPFLSFFCSFSPPVKRPPCRDASRSSTRFVVCSKLHATWMQRHPDCVQQRRDRYIYLAQRGGVISICVEPDSSHTFGLWWCVLRFWDSPLNSVLADNDVTLGDSTFCTCASYMASSDAAGTWRTSDARAGFNVI